MNVVIIGKNGQLASELLDSAPQGVEAVAFGRDDIDWLEPDMAMSKIGSHNPSWIINTSAYTAVDAAESDQQAAEFLNADVPKLLADIAENIGARLVHLSTDFVFDGTSSRPYKVGDKTNPLSVYGQTKRDGEIAVIENSPTAIVVRTSWVFSRFGNNFVKTMLRLMSERDQLSVVADQIGSPTSASDLAQFLWQLICEKTNAPGLLHWTNAGVCSWYDFAVAIEQLGREAGLLSSPTEIAAIPATAYPTPAARPAYSVLDKAESWDLTQQSRHWRIALADVIQQIKDSSNHA